MPINDANSPSISETPVAREARVDVAVALYLQLVESGRPPAPEQFLADHSDIAEELATFLVNRERVQSLLGDVAGESDLTLPGHGPAGSTWNSAQDPGNLNQTTLPFHSNGNGIETAAASQFGDYEILAPIARGGMGIVYKARHVKLNRVVALKMILSGQLATPLEIERFHSEAAAAAQLDHPGIVPVYEVGEHDGRHFYAMGFVDGPSLSVQQAAGPMAPREAARLMKSVAEAVHFAHEHGVIHRDLKPGNILLDSQSRPRVADFGLAKQLEGASDLTRTGQIVGTPAYMAPEQAGDQATTVGPAADVYGLGAILYYLLVGRPPFQAAHPVETMRQALEQDPVPPRQLNSAVPLDLETIVLKCLEKSPVKRYLSARLLGDELQRFLEGRPITARPVSRFERAGRWIRRNPVVASASSLTVVLLLTTAVISLVAYAREAKLASDLAIERNTVKSALEAKTKALFQETAARQESREELYRSLLAQARARRLSHEPGRRFQSLAAVAKAAKIHPTAELRNEAIAALALVDVESVRPLEGATHDIYHVAFDQKVKHYAVFERDGRLRLRRASDGQPVAILHIPFPTMTSFTAVFSPDGNWLVITAGTTAGSTICLYRVAPAADQVDPVWQWPGNHHGFNLDSRRLLVRSADDSPLVWYDLSSGEPAGQIVIPPGPFSARLSPDGERLAINRQTSVEVVSITDGTVIRQWHPSEKLDSWPAAWSPDSRFLSAGADDFKVYVWDVAQNRVHSELAGHALHGIRTAFSPSGEFLISSGWDGTIRFWDYQQGHPIMSMRGHFYAINDQSQAMALYNVDEGRIELWRVAGNAAFQTLYHPMVGNQIRAPTAGGPRGAGFSSNGSWIAAGSGDGIRVWNAVSGKEQLHLPAPECDSALFHPVDGSLITYSGWGVQRWPLLAANGSSDQTANQASRQLTTHLLGQPQEIFAGSGGPEYNHLALDAAGRNLIVCDKARQQALIFNLADGGPPAVLGPHPGIRWVDISPDGRHAVTGQWNRGFIKVWDVTTGQLLKDWPGTSNLGRFSADERWMVTLADPDKQLQFWRVPDWLPGPRIGYRHALWHRASFCRAAPLMALSDVLGLRLFDSANLEELGALRLADDRAKDVDSCFSPGGDLLAGFGESTIHVWNLTAIRTALRTLGLDWSLPDAVPAHANEAAMLVASPVLNQWLAHLSPATAAERCGRLTTAGQWNEAVDAYETLFAAGWPSDNMRRFERALLYAWLGKTDSLRKFCSEQFQADPHSFWAARCAYLAIEAVDDWGPALHVVETAIAREPGEPFHWAELGATQVRAGQFENAQKSLQRFLDPHINPNYHVYGWLWTSLACLGADHPEEARAWLKKATDWLDAAELGQPPAEGNGPLAGAWWFRLELRLLRREVEERLAEN